MEYTECKDCKNMYKCEHTYIGGCSNGNPWEIKTIGTPEEFLEITNKIREESSYNAFVNTFIKKENKDKDSLIDEILFDIGPTMTINHNGKEQQVIFYPKESLAKVLIARGWTKMNLDQIEDDMSKLIAKKFARLIEFHAVSTRDNNGNETFTISKLGIQEILREDFGFSTCDIDSIYEIKDNN